MTLERRLKYVLLPLFVVSISLAVYFRDNVVAAFYASAPSAYMSANPGITAVSKAGSTPHKESTPDTPAYRFRTDGLVELITARGSHPIYEIISSAEKEWNAKVDRASKSLTEAITEYRRRYNRPPPKGFDLWWQYVQTHQVQLPDEYDQIYKDLEPFWGVDPVELQALQTHEESVPETYTMGKNETSGVEVLLISPADPENPHIRGAQDLIELLKDVEHLLPPFRAVFSPHDNPSLLSDYRVKKFLVDAAANGTYAGNHLPQAAEEGWVSACPPSSPARRFKLNVDSPPRPSPNKTFIYDHRLSMDPCLHPELFHHHGEFLGHGSGPPPQQTMVPRFADCSTLVHHDIQRPSLLAWVEDFDDPEWDDKLDERLSWRGSNTGMWHDIHTPWKYSQRDRLVAWASDMNGTASVLASSVQIGGLGVVEMPKSRMNPAMLDIAFAGKPIQCSPEVCEEMERLFDWRQTQSPKEAGNYKYVIDMDGNAWSSRFKRQLTSNRLVFKATIYPEWFLDRIAPWVHYVPVQVDLSDLYDAFIFFRGGMYGEGAHDELAHRIARAGREWSKSYWRREDMTAYLFRLFLEYSRVMSLDRESMSYYPPNLDE